jgi:hypothetical protein
LALHLESIDESSEWLVDLVNDNSNTGAKISSSELMSLQLTQKAFHGLLNDLFDDLK